MPDIHKIRDTYGNSIIFQIIGNYIYIDIEGPRGGKYGTLVFSNVGFGEIIQTIKDLEEQIGQSKK